MLTYKLTLSRYKFLRKCLDLEKNGLTEGIETSKPQQIMALAYQKQKSDEIKHADPDTLKICIQQIVQGDRDFPQDQKTEKALE